ncbi:hypothetical protein H5410_049149 [Solanum commersonii]|uniref:Uncharacterized protein n=1 Tax=Solanum commersonii TaxID=4109 RepID=A0A9J5XK89_SOLCO|nr:hypothetical protein H5410_049149 [Solanum commersonii]
MKAISFIYILQQTASVLGIEETTIEWLDEFSQGSVHCVSFGSHNTISASQMKAQGLGLEHNT